MGFEKRIISRYKILNFRFLRFQLLLHLNVVCLDQLIILLKLIELKLSLLQGLI